jgi:hypothetical protein
VAKRKTARAKRAKAEKATPKKDASDMKLAIAILIFGLATAYTAIYKMGSITILFGLVTAAAALAIALKNR